MHAFINPYVIKFRFSDVPICEWATEHGNEKTQWKQQLGNAGLQGQAKQHRAPGTGPSMVLALFHITNALDTVFKEHWFMHSEYVWQRKATEHLKSNVKQVP